MTRSPDSQESGLFISNFRRNENCVQVVVLQRPIAPRTLFLVRLECFLQRVRVLDAAVFRGELAEAAVELAQGLEFGFVEVFDRDQTIARMAVRGQQLVELEMQR